MGQIQNKTYTAPDGSVYQVENDGSITKIKGGKIQSNEPPSKYQITDDGQIYRVESDGSVTYLGNAEAKKAYTNKSNINKTKKSHGWIWILLILGLVGLGIYALVYYNKQNSIQPYNDKPHATRQNSYESAPPTIREECDTHAATPGQPSAQSRTTACATTSPSTPCIGAPAAVASTGHVSAVPVVEVDEDENIYEVLEDENIYEVVEQNAQFPGGDEACYNWLSNHIMYPAICQELGIQGRVFVSFVVNKDGSIADVKVSRSPDDNLSKEAVRVVKEMPKWKPARQGNRTVRSRFTLPIMFRLN